MFREKYPFPLIMMVYNINLNLVVIHFVFVKLIEILNNQNNVYINSAMEKFHIHKEVRKK